jgi:predicted methyltransferase
LIGVSLDEDKATAERMIFQKGIFWPQICDGKADKGEIAKLYNVQGTPVLLLIDRAGNIAGRLSSATMLDQQLLELTTTDALPPRTQRDTWQRPVKVADTLGIQVGSAVADVGAGGGYFTFRLAARVGPKGKVYAEDLDDKELAGIRERSDQEKLTQIQTIQGSQEGPKLPELSLDAVLIVDAFHEFTHPDRMTAGILRALKPGGRLGVMDRSAPLGLKSTDYMERHFLPQETLIDQVTRTGLRLVSFDSDFAGSPDGTRYYFAVFEKPVQ